MVRTGGKRRYTWGRFEPVHVDLRNRELAARLKSLISLRWIAAGSILLLATSGVVGGPWLTRAPSLLLFVGLGLVAANVVYALFGARPVEDSERVVRRGRRWMITQILVDYAALSVVLYAVGSGATSVASLFLIHIGLTTLLLPRSISLPITGLAWCGAAGPFVLEWLAILPPVGRLAVHAETLRPLDSAALWVHLGGIALTWGVAWFLFSVVTGSLKRSERDLEDANIRLTTLARDKATETLRATHELKAPFAAIKSYVYTLRDGYCGELPEQAARVVERIGARCDALTGQISELIHLGNLKTMVLTHDNRMPVDLCALVDEEVSEIRVLGEPRKVKLIVREGADCAGMVGDPGQLRTLISNLLRNAIDYSHDGGTVQVWVEVAQDTSKLVVADEGIGIPSENLDKIFDEHFRSNNAAKHHTGGTGLGLAIVREIARMHAATVSVQSTVGEGSAFTVEFPHG